jgi:hypothetical protein
MTVRRIWPTGWRAIVLLIVGGIMGANLITPAVAHIGSTLSHLYSHADQRYVRKTAPQLRFVDLQLYGGFLQGGAAYDTGFGPNAGMDLPNAGTPNFAYEFTIPRWYRSGTNLTLRVVWHTSGTSCGINLSPNFTSFARPGRTHIIGPTASTGLTAVGGNTLNAPATANQSSAKNYTISTPVAGTPLKARDTVIIGLFRSSAAAEDTCTSDLVIQGLSITYPA